jgi:hypothetical protein
LLVKPYPAEAARIQAFFARMDEPLEPPVAEVGGVRKAAPSPFFITGLGVLGIGAMLVLVSFFTVSATGRWIDLGAGAVLLLLGWLLYRTRPAVESGSSTEPESEEVAVAGSVGGA